jgi:hypothetical protein
MKIREDRFRLEPQKPKRPFAVSLFEQRKSFILLTHPEVNYRDPIERNLTLLRLILQ